MRRNLSTLAIARLTQRLQDYLSAPKRDIFQEEARQLQALPVFLDLFAIWYIRPTGEILLSNYNDQTDDWDVSIFEPADEQGTLETNWHTWIRLLVLNTATMRYPEFAELLPLRAPETPDCPDCHGTGKKIGTDGQPINFPCRGCASLGWVPPELTASLRQA